MNGLGPTAGGFGYPSYPCALINVNPNPLGQKNYIIKKKIYYSEPYNPLGIFYYYYSEP